MARIIQTNDSISDCEADIISAHGRPLQITYGYVRAAQRSGPVNVPEVLAAAIRRNKFGSVIVSTRKPERLRQFAEISGLEDKSTALSAAGSAQ
ncbi:MAG: hypothetical protein M3Z96_11315 [Pseudomonadota bacterium]|nr:hypothetical protein [Pseudomonadota bacterium]